MTEEYLTIAEVAARLKLEPKSFKNKMAAGILQKGVHWFSPDVSERQRYDARADEPRMNLSPRP